MHVENNDHCYDYFSKIMKSFCDRIHSLIVGVPLEETQDVEGVGNICWIHGLLLHHLLDAEGGLVLDMVKVLQNDRLPVGSVGDTT